jgi:hypothetical protein
MQKINTFLTRNRTLTLASSVKPGQSVKSVRQFIAAVASAALQSGQISQKQQQQLLRVVATHVSPIAA